MIAISVENLTISGFIEVINTQTFDLDELDEFITGFYNKAKIDIIEDYKIHLKQLEVIKNAEQNKDFKKEYEKSMDEIDEIILSRSEYFAKIESKYKYKGRYGKKSNILGNARNGKSKNNKGYKTPEQLCFMQEGWQ